MLFDNFNQNQDSDSKILNRNYLEMLNELDNYSSNVNVTYDSLELDSGKLDYAKEELGLITGSAHNVLMTEKGYNYLLTHRLSKNIENQNKKIESLNKNIDSLKSSLRDYNSAALLFTGALVVIGIAQISANSEILSETSELAAIVGAVIFMSLGALSAAVWFMKTH